ncbi:TIGR03915 family putative DNA repair protein [Polaromonas sp. YR568]|uniref:TIGR03915 family putative DNA repair protein n=1 Tax=Polaromonas sp. YR568 TaxID=1855301 RepID=UPI00398BEDFF
MKSDREEERMYRMGVMNDLLTTDLFPQALLPVTLQGQADFEGFRRAARGLLAQNILPEQVSWRCSDTPLESPKAAGTAHSPAFSDAPAVHVPPEFFAMCQAAVLHNNPQRFKLLYRLLWRLVHEPQLRHNPLDADMEEARRMAEDVRQDMQAMKAQLRFRSVQDDTFRARPLAGPLHVAWYEPEHHIVDAVAPFFAKRFSQMRWAILTPESSVESDYLGPQDEGTVALRFGPGADPQDAPTLDAGEQHWLTQYEQVFHPARLRRRRMMQKAAASPQRYRKGRGAAGRKAHAPRAQSPGQAASSQPLSRS